MRGLYQVLDILGTLLSANHELAKIHCPPHDGMEHVGHFLERVEAAHIDKELPMLDFMKMHAVHAVAKAIYKKVQVFGQGIADWHWLEFIFDICTILLIFSEEESVTSTLDFVEAHYDDLAAGQCHTMEISVTRNQDHLVPCESYTLHAVAADGIITFKEEKDVIALDGIKVDLLACCKFLIAEAAIHVHLVIPACKVIVKI